MLQEVVPDTAPTFWGRFASAGYSCCPEPCIPGGGRLPYFTLAFVRTASNIPGSLGVADGMTAEIVVSDSSRIPFPG